MFYDDFKEGTKYNTNNRTITETDSVLFSTLTGAYNPIFLDETYAAKTRFKGRIVPGLLTVAVCTGSIYQLPAAPFGAGFVALAGMSMNLTKPVRPGNTIHAEVTVANKEMKGSNGLVTLAARVLNQDSETVAEVEYKIIVLRK